MLEYSNCFVEQARWLMTHGLAWLLELAGLELLSIHLFK